MRNTICAVVVVAGAAALTAQGLGPDIPDVRPELIASHMRFLADDLLEGRGTGTRGFQLAAQYVATQFEGLGLEPAFAGRFQQPVPLRHAQVVGDESSITLRRGQQEQRLSFAMDFVASGDMHRESVSLDAPIVFVGDGVSAAGFGYDDYAGVDGRGKIAAIVLRAIPLLQPAPAAYFGNLDVRIEAAIDHGAVGFLLMSPDDSFPWERNLQLSFQGLSSATGPSGLPLEPSKPLAVGVLRFEATRRLFELASLDLVGTVAQHRNGQLPSMLLPVMGSMRIRSRHTTLDSANVGAVLRGSDPNLKDEFVVYTAHLDHVGRGRPVDGDDIYNGAIDNASGVAAMLAMAQAMTRLPARPRRSALFLATTGEEIGMLGSKYFVAQPAVPLQNIAAVVNIDGPTLMLLPVRRVQAQGGIHSTLGRAAAVAAARLGLDITQVAAPTISDQGPLLLRGVPVLWALAAPDSGRPDADGATLAREWMSRIYHSPKDDLNRTLDFGAAVTMARFNLLIGLQVAQDETQPRWNPGDFFGETFDRKPRP